MTDPLLHARFWKNHDPSGQDQIRFDPNQFGLKAIKIMALLVEQNPEYLCNDVPLQGVIIRHQKGNILGHQVHVAATKEQWDAVREYLKVVDNERLS